MYYNIKKNILELLDTIEKMTIFCKDHPEQIKTYGEDYKLAFSSIKNRLPGDMEFESIFGKIDQILQMNNAEEYIEKLSEAVGILRTKINNIPVRYRMYFLPYKASMWTSMESIFLEAKKDNCCDAFVMPIPYHTMYENRKAAQEYYEGDCFPQDIIITDYKIVDLEVEQPEFIFVHNPYDACNNVTSVEENFFCKHLRKYTNALVYCPYFTYISSSDQDTRLIDAPGVFYSKYIILQSEKAKNMFIANGYQEERFLIYGSPKIDAIARLDEAKVQIPDAWKQKLDSRKVILYTFSLAAASNEAWLEQILICMKKHWEDDEIGFIFRPHPLVMDYCKGRKKSERWIRQIFDFAQQDDRFVLDLNESYLPAFVMSDAFMLSDASSLINEYMVTGKPLYWDKMDFDKNPDIQKEQRNGLINLTTLYCPHYEEYPGQNSEVASHDAGVRQFFSVVKNGDDYKKRDRLEAVKRAFTTIDGTAGEKIYQALIEKEIVMGRQDG